MNISKMSLLLAIVGLISVADACAYKSHKVQVVLNPLNQAWNPQYSFWALNTASNGISYNFADDRDLGSYYVAKGLMFKKGTVNKYQSDYGLDKHGNTLQQSDSLGSWLAVDFIINGYNLTDNFPVSGTILTEGNWSYFFNNSEKHDNLYSVGRQKANELSMSNGAPLQYGKFSINGGTGKYASQSDRPHIVSAKWYLSVAGNVLINIEFKTQEIQVEAANK